jgi:hypothetical protein|nr:hypothetical protein [Kofleriaceae bacterium]
MRALSMVLAAAVLAGGCVSESYKISHGELVRMSQLPPDQRTQAVRVDQEPGNGEDVGTAERVDDGTQIILVPSVDIEVDGGGHRHLGGAPVGHVGHGGGVGGVHAPAAGSDDKAAAIVYVALAVVALVAVVAVEASRFDGLVRLHPMHPLHLVADNGDVVTVPAAWLDRDMAAWADHAVVRSAEGPWHPIATAPLERGWTYGVFLGEGTYVSADGSKGTGFAATIQLGYFVTQHVGIVGSGFLGWRTNLEDKTLFEGRFMGEVQVLPLDAGIFHAGVYGAIGEAIRSEDGVMTADTDKSTLALGGGAMMQLELHTRVALTARFGVANAHGETAQDVLVGLAVY